LRAAKGQFASRGYHGATIRSIAADAGVDPALVHHFYGTKEHLFGAAMRLPVLPSEVIGAALAPGGLAPGAGLGEHMVRTFLGIWEIADVRATFLGLLRSAMTSENAAAMLSEFITDTILAPIARVAGAPGPGREVTRDAEYRATMVGTQMIGLAMARYVLAIPPVADASPDDLAKTVGPTLDRYLAGGIRRSDP
jgi:AcrR family transcriptional regulator